MHVSTTQHRGAPWPPRHKTLLPGGSVLFPLANGGPQMAALVLHGQAVLRRHVQLLAGYLLELQALHKDGQEEEDLGTADGLADAAPLARTEDHHLLALHLVELAAVSR